MDFRLSFEPAPAAAVPGMSLGEALRLERELTELASRAAGCSAKDVQDAGLHRLELGGFTVRYAWDHVRGLLRVHSVERNHVDTCVVP